VLVRPGAGGSDRITIIWADNAIQRTWLQVTVLANAHTGLTSSDVFYFGNLPGDANGDGTVGVADYLTVKWQYGTTVPVPGSGADFDCSGDVGRGDLAAVGPNFGTSLNMTFSPPVPVAAPVAAPVETTTPDAGQAGADPVQTQSPAAKEPQVVPAPVDNPHEVASQDPTGDVSAAPPPATGTVSPVASEPALLPAEPEDLTSIGTPQVLPDALGCAQVAPQLSSAPLPAPVAAVPTAAVTEGETALTEVATAPARLGITNLGHLAAGTLPVGFDVLGSALLGADRSAPPARWPGRSMMVALALPTNPSSVGPLPQRRSRLGWLDWKPAADAAEFGSNGTPGTQPQAMDVLAVPALHRLRTKGPIGLPNGPLA
jgi:hypothetical protein